MGYYRFLNNERVNAGEISKSLSNQCQERIEGLQVLAISDSSEVNLSRHRQRLKKEKLGVLSNNKDVGLFIHPTLVLDAEDGMPLGLSDVYWWSRPPEREDKHTRKYKQLEIEEKESYKWLQAAQRSQKCWAAAAERDLHRRPGSRHLRTVGIHTSAICPCSIPHESRSRLSKNHPKNSITT
jgi:hypothetical protein